MFKPATIKEIGGKRIAIIGQAFPYVPIAHPKRFTPDWTFGIREPSCRKLVDGLRAERQGRRRHPACRTTAWMSISSSPAASPASTSSSAATRTTPCRSRSACRNAGGKTLVTNAGSNGKFLGVLDLDLDKGKVKDVRYHLLPVFAGLLQADAGDAGAHRRACASRMRQSFDEKLAVAGDLLYRRGNFNGTMDQLICDALARTSWMREIALSPGFRWGNTMLPGEAITMERCAVGDRHHLSAGLCARR